MNCIYWMSQVCSLHSCQYFIFYETVMYCLLPPNHWRTVGPDIILDMNWRKPEVPLQFQDRVTEFKKVPAHERMPHTQAGCLCVFLNEEVKGWSGTTLMGLISMWDLCLCTFCQRCIFSSFLFFLSVSKTLLLYFGSVGLWKNGVVVFGNRLYIFDLKESKHFRGLQFCGK